MSNETQTPTRPRYKRRQFFINRSLQLRYMFILLGILLVVMGFSIATMYYGIWGSVLKELSDEGIRNQLIVANRIYQYEKARQINAGDDGSNADLNFIRETELLSQREREIFKEILNRTNKRIFIYLLPIFIFIGWGTVFLSHRIAGPLYRFNQCFKNITKGDLTARAHLRKGDEALFLSESFNEMAESLERKVSSMKQASSNGSKETLEKSLSDFKTTS
jgi:methyl-accepting chemotaxis protein